MVIDSHQHFWRYSPLSHAWINEQMGVLKKDFLPPDLSPIFINNGVDGCVAVQADQSEEETLFLLNLADEYDFIKGVVGWVDLRSEHVEERLAWFSKFDKLCGFRHIVQDEPDDQFMLSKDFQRGISLLNQYHFTYDILVYPNQMEAALELVQHFPQQKFVLDHIAKPYIREGKIDRWASHIEQIAAYPNVWCKISGIVTEADWSNWTYLEIEPYLEIVQQAFGADRLMYGSDWPVCLLAAIYREVKEVAEAFSEYFTAIEKDKFFGQNAIDFYRLSI